jgi:hypothetical protein
MVAVHGVAPGAMLLDLPLADLVGQVLVLHRVAGEAVELYMSLDTNDTTGYISPSAFRNPVLCSSGDIGYAQAGSPYSVMLPDLKGDVLTGGGPPCLDLGEWVDSHLNYWHLFLNGVFWTYTIYFAVLIPAHVIRWSASRLRTRRLP